MNSERFTVQTLESPPLRADRFIASLGLFTRSQISRRAVRVRFPDGRAMKMSRKLRIGEEIILDWDDPEPAEIAPEPLDLTLIYEDHDCLVINKAQGVVVHPAVGHTHGTLVQGLLHYCAGLENAFGGDKIRPGIVHRLDKDTSGLIIAAKHPRALESLSRHFREGSVEKTYLALTQGVPSPVSGTIDRPIGRDPRNRKRFAVNVPNAKHAETLYRVLDSRPCAGTRVDIALLRVNILTGRTHQIRVHLKSIGTPVIGDPIYSRPRPEFPEASLMLHSWKLTIPLPNGQERQFTAPLPQRFTHLSRRFGLDPGR